MITITQQTKEQSILSTRNFVVAIQQQLLLILLCHSIISTVAFGTTVAMINTVTTTTTRISTRRIATVMCRHNNHCNYYNKRYHDYKHPYLLYYEDKYHDIHKTTTMYLYPKEDDYNVPNDDDSLEPMLGVQVQDTNDDDNRNDHNEQQDFLERYIMDLENRNSNGNTNLNELPIPSFTAMIILLGSLYITIYGFYVGIYGFPVEQQANNNDIIFPRIF